jgi:hypothetical protein
MFLVVLSSAQGVGIQIRCSFLMNDLEAIGLN